MDALGFTFLITAIIGGAFLAWTYTKSGNAFLAWTYTKSGKKWIDSL